MTETFIARRQPVNRVTSRASSRLLRGGGRFIGDSMKTKTCRTCGIEKPSSEFNTHRKTLDGLQSWCKPCFAVWSKQWKAEKMKDPAYVLRYRHAARTTAVRRPILSDSQKSAARKRNRERHKKRRIESPLQCRAWDAVKYAIKTKRLLKMPCEVCGSKKSNAHHDDYSKPLDVRWFCHDHHMAHHAALRDAALLALIP